MATSRLRAKLACWGDDRLVDGLSTFHQIENRLKPVKMPNRKTNWEGKLQKQCIEAARLKYGTLGLILASFPNEGKRSVWEAQRLKLQGLQPGMPDLVIFWDAKTLFIEFKWGKNKLTPKQERMHRLLKGQGFRVETIYDFDSFLKVLEEFTGM